MREKHVCRCAFVCESLAAFGLKEEMLNESFCLWFQKRKRQTERGRKMTANGRIIRSSRAYNRGIPITRGVRQTHTHTHTHTHS